ncbi:hypothetical protein LCGC14_0310610 [marine sediment metagenome]|uniref:Bacteriophage Mu GpT domain-containing protein n=1 Tax=marine sediment metagenome TaxID=412755 RepID=A0A0F9WTS4_9ZZZZ
MSVTTREMTSTTHAAFLPTIWSKDTRNAITFKEVLSKRVNTKFEAEMSIGRTLQIPIRANYDTQTKTEGISNTIHFQSQPGTTGSGTNFQSITISTYEYAAALLNAVVAAQSNYEERKNIADGLGYALMRGVEVSISNLFQSFSQITGALGAEPDDAVLRRSWQFLADAAADEGDTSWIWSPGAVAALFGNDKFSSKDFINKPVIESATLPMLYAAPSFRSNLLRIPASGQSDCALLHREAVILIRQILPTVRQQFVLNNLSDGVVAYDLYNASEAIWAAETPPTDSDPTPGDFGAVLIRAN